MLNRMHEVQNMRVKHTRFPAVIMALIVILCGMMLAASHADAADRPNENVPELTQSTSSFRMNFCYTDDDKTTPIPGATFMAYRVADLTVKNGIASYELTPAFASLNVDFNGLTASDSAAVAKEAAKLTGNASGVSATSKASGIANFGALKHGAYLLVQTGAAGEAKKYGEMPPWLVLLPELLGEAGNYSWNYDVEAMPKPILGKDEDEEDDHDTDDDDDEIGGGDKEEEENHEKSPFEKLVKTGDDAQIFLYAGILILTLLCLAVIFVKRRKKE